MSEFSLPMASIQSLVAWAQQVAGLLEALRLNMQPPPLAIKHGKSAPGLVRVPPNRATEVKPERDGMVVPAAGWAHLTVKVNFVDLPPAASGNRPTRLNVWFRRPSEGDPNNATGTQSFAVPQDDEPTFKLTHTYPTRIEHAGDVVRAIVSHNGSTTITADLAQFMVFIARPEVP